MCREDFNSLDFLQFQRIQAEPASLTVIRYTSLRPFVARLNDIGGDVGGLIPQPKAQDSGGGDSDAVVGGDA